MIPSKKASDRLREIQDKAGEAVRYERLKRLIALQIYHRRKMDSITRELEALLKDEINRLDY
jgi:hypothetical protein